MSADNVKESKSDPGFKPGKGAMNSAGNWLVLTSKRAYGRTRIWIKDFLDAINRKKPASIDYRYLARQLTGQFAESEKNPCIVFSSVDSLEASCDVLMMIAYYLHDELEARVLLVDGSLTSGGVGDRFGYAGEPGLIDYFCESGDTLDDNIKPTSTPGVFLLPAGKMPKEGRPVVRSESVKALMEKLNSQFDFVLVQQGPVTLDTRYMVFARLADLVLLYLEEGSTLASELEASQKIFRDYQIQNVGFILLKSSG